MEEEVVEIDDTDDVTSLCLPVVACIAAFGSSSCCFLNALFRCRPAILSADPTFSYRQSERRSTKHRLQVPGRPSHLIRL